MFFEGCEKKAEIIVSGEKLRARGKDFWTKMVELAGAKVLSITSNEQCDAYLLSESSLFVWDDRVTMITCGRTTLVNAIHFFLDHISIEKVSSLLYERKNEYFPHQQHTDFYSDVRNLRTRVPGKALRFGHPDEHHLMLFHMEKDYKPASRDCTLEILMYNLQGASKEIFHSGQTLDRVRELTKVDEIFPGFKVDDYLFQPCGYSLNAINGKEYYTIHVTPEEIGSYVSFETNVLLGNRFTSSVKNILNVFQPQSFDLIYFHPDRELKSFDFSPYTQRNFVRNSMVSGYEVGFSSYFLQPNEPTSAFELEIK